MSSLTEFLDSNKVEYSTISHSPAYTAQQTAQSAHIPGKELAKTIILKVDGRIAMAVLPADHSLDFEVLKQDLGAKEVELAREHEFSGMFPECEVGAMPPFGNLYNMETYVADSLKDVEEIAFNAGSHSELIRMRFKDWDLLVHPKTLPHC